MEYKVKAYHRGELRYKGKQEAQSAKDAAKLFYSTIGGNVSHFVVTGKTTVRLTKKFVKVDAEPRFWKVVKNGTAPAILVMFDNLAEFSVYKSVEERDKAYEEILKCTTSTSVESARTEAEQIVTTASSEETEDTKSTLMSRKTLSGSVTNATWRDWLTRDSTGKSSGIAKSGDTAIDTWSSGSKASRSKPVKTFLATVKPLPKENAPWPGVNSNMQAMAGKTYLFKDNGGSFAPYHSKGYVWIKRWLDTENIYAKVKDMGEVEPHITKYGTKIKFNGEFAGKILHLKKCGCGCGAYYYNEDSYYYPEWLEFETYTAEDCVKQNE